MDTRDPKTNSELGRHQRVLDAYLAHAGNDPMPPASLDAKLIALAASSVKATSKGSETIFSHNDADLVSPIRTSSRRRRWPFALAASVATIGFAAILARSTFQDSETGYGAPVYPAAPSYEAKNVAADQAIAADAAVADAAATGAMAAIETPAPPAEERSEKSPDQSASWVAAMSAPEDKAKLSGASGPALARAVEQGLVESERAANKPALVEPDQELVAKSAAAPMPAPAEATVAEATVAEPTVADLSAPAASEPLSEVSVSGARTRRSEVNVDAAPIVNMPAADNAIAEIAAPKPQSAAAADAQAEASAPLDYAANSKKDEFASNAQSSTQENPANLHTKTYTAIRALRDGGELQQAKAMLARFRKAYPREVLPEDLKMLEKAK